MTETHQPFSFIKREGTILEMLGIKDSEKSIIEFTKEATRGETISDELFAYSLIRLIATKEAETYPLLICFANMLGIDGNTETIEVIINSVKDTKARQLVVSLIMDIE